MRVFPPFAPVSRKPAYKPGLSRPGGALFPVAVKSALAGPVRALAARA
jgi:hypothetical protein